jgi:hypothetical protein
MQHESALTGSPDLVLPLVRSIGREIAERRQALESLESRRDELDGGRELWLIDAECSAHRRGIRHAREELRRLGCSLIGTEPLTIRISCDCEEGKRSFLWSVERDDVRVPGV